MSREVAALADARARASQGCNNIDSSNEQIN